MSAIMSKSVSCAIELLFPVYKTGFNHFLYIVITMFVDFLKSQSREGQLGRTLKSTVQRIVTRFKGYYLHVRVHFFLV